MVVFIGIQFIHPKIENPPATGSLSAPPEVVSIIRTSCYDCHSNETNLKWFDEIVPAYWLVSSHIKNAREVLNFSEWDKLAPAEQKSKLYLALNKILEKEMPLSDYMRLHTEAKLTDDKIAVLKNYLLTLSPRKLNDTAAIAKAETQYNHWLGNQSLAAHTKVSPAPNGIEYIAAYQNWKAISTTDRFDNGTMRVIFGNDVAVKAIKEGTINPWPDGAILAKAAWTQIIDSAGVARTGEFKQVEFMIKDHDKYATTKGWGWARWRGMDLKPYGKDALFTTECINCHTPLKGNDFAFTMPLNLDTK